MNTLPWYLELGSGPLVGVAIHHGHAIREDLAGHLAISEEVRLREEDPRTGGWTDVAPNRIVVYRSRFEVDLNRPREKAVYRTEDDAWGLHVWKDGLDEDAIEKSLAVYDVFYQELNGLLTRITNRYRLAVVLDLHSYNHRRGGPSAPPADPQANPEINIGTGTMDRGRWAGVVDRFIHDMRDFDFLGRSLDVRENVRFQGGHLSKWVHETFPESVCVLSVEVKKFFMDEWTAEVDSVQTSAVRRALKSTVWGIYEELHRLTGPSRAGSIAEAWE